jgi:hypothetical protein
MTGGFAVLATPVKYAETGITTFVLGSDGVIYERDLGADTVNLAASIQEYNPTDDWSQVEWCFRPQERGTQKERGFPVLMFRAESTLVALS